MDGLTRTDMDASLEASGSWRWEWEGLSHKLIYAPSLEGLSWKLKERQRLSKEREGQIDRQT